MHRHDALATFVAAALPAAHGAHGVGVLAAKVAAVVVLGVVIFGGVVLVVDVGRAVVGGVVPGGDFGRGGDAGGAGGGFGGCDERGGWAEDGVEVGVDVGFDVDGVGGRAGVDERYEDAQADAEHGRSGAAEVGGRFAGFVKGFLAVLGEGDDFG